MVTVVPDTSEVAMLEHIVNKTANSDLVLRLYTNNYTPIETSIATDFIEAEGNGYFSITLTGSSWSVTSGNPCVASFVQQTFTFTGSLGSVYGFYVTRGNGDLMWAEKFASVVNVANNGDAIKVTLSFTLSD